MPNVYQLCHKHTLNLLSSKLAMSPSWWIWKELQSWISCSWCLIWIQITIELFHIMSSKSFSSVAWLHLWKKPWNKFLWQLSTHIFNAKSTLIVLICGLPWGCLWAKLFLIMISEGGRWHLWNIYKIISTFASKKATRTHIQFGKHEQITLDMFYKANGTWVN